MTLVFFRGYGAWVIRKNKDIKFLYPRLQPEEYRGHLTIMSDNYGDHFDTIDEVSCREYIGVFKLNAIDSAIHECTRQLDVSKIETLLPCMHEHSVFNQLIAEGRTAESDLNDCEFEIQRTFILRSHTTERYPEIKFLDTYSAKAIVPPSSTHKMISKSIDQGSKDSIDVYFSGSGTWFDKRDGSLIYPKNDKKSSHFSFPPRHQLFGVFSINNEEDILTYKHTGNFDHVSKLVPNDHVNSAFLKMVDDGIFSKFDIEHYFFKLPRKLKSKTSQRFERKENVLVIANLIEQNVSKNNPPPINDFPSNVAHSEGKQNAGTVPIKKSLKDRRYDSLRAFINWLEIEVKKNNINTFNAFELDCTTSHLLTALKSWEVDRTSKVDFCWQGIDSWNSSGGFWSSKERKCICDIRDDRRGGGKSNNDNIFKIIKMDGF